MRNKYLAASLISLTVATGAAVQADPVHAATTCDASSYRPHGDRSWVTGVGIVNCTSPIYQIHPVVEAAKAVPERVGHPDSGTERLLPLERVRAWRRSLQPRAQHVPDQDGWLCAIHRELVLVQRHTPVQLVLHGVVSASATTRAVFDGTCGRAARTRRREAPVLCAVS
jgi:hypothetical protein